MNEKKRIFVVLLLGVLILGCTNLLGFSIEPPTNNSIKYIKSIAMPNTIIFTLTPPQTIENVYYRVNGGKLDSVAILGNNNNYVFLKNISLKKGKDTLEFWIYSDGYKIFNYKISENTSFMICPKLDTFGVDEPRIRPRINKLLNIK